MRVAVLIEPGAVPAGQRGRGTPPARLVDESRAREDAALAVAGQFAASLDAELVVLAASADGSPRAARHGLACGADRGVVLHDPALRTRSVLALARAFSALLRQQVVDVVVAGVEDRKAPFGTLPAMIAELLGASLGTGAVAVERASGEAAVVTATLLSEDATSASVVPCTLPLVVTAVPSMVDPQRLVPSYGDVLASRDRPVEVVPLAALGLGAAELPAVGRPVRAAAPSPYPGRISGPDAPARLADYLRLIGVAR